MTVLTLSASVPPPASTSRPWYTIFCIARRTVGPVTWTRSSDSDLFSHGSPRLQLADGDRVGELLGQLVVQRRG